LRMFSRIAPDSSAFFRLSQARGASLQSCRYCRSFVFSGLPLSSNRVFFGTIGFGSSGLRRPPFGSPSPILEAVPCGVIFLGRAFPFPIESERSSFFCFEAQPFPLSVGQAFLAPGYRFPCFPFLPHELRIVLFGDLLIRPF